MNAFYRQCLDYARQPWLIILCLSLLTGGVAWAKDPSSFTQEDRARLIRLETTLQLFMEATDKRFEQIDRRFAESREATDQRFAELREDMNKRFEQIDKRFEQVDKRFEQVDKRFEQVDKRFEQMMDTLQMIAAIFTTLTLGVIGFAYWDRRSVIRKARESTLETLERTTAGKAQELVDRAAAQAVRSLEQEGQHPNLIAALRQLAAADQPLAQVLHQYHLL